MSMKPPAAAVVAAGFRADCGRPIAKPWSADTGAVLLVKGTFAAALRLGGYAPVRYNESAEKFTLI